MTPDALERAVDELRNFPRGIGIYLVDYTDDRIDLYGETDHDLPAIASWDLNTEQYTLTLLTRSTDAPVRLNPLTGPFTPISLLRTLWIAADPIYEDDVHRSDDPAIYADEIAAYQQRVHRQLQHPTPATSEGAGHA